MTTACSLTRGTAMYTGVVLVRSGKDVGAPLDVLQPTHGRM